MAEKKHKKLVFERTLEVDEEALYGPLPAAIAYLQGVHEKHPTAQLAEHWPYETFCELRFVWQEEETDEAYEARLKGYEEQRQRRLNEKNPDFQREQRRKVWEKLKKEFGNG